MKTKSKNPARELTLDEAREKFLRHVWTIVKYWDESDNRQSQYDRMTGLAFSILVALDGEAADLPASEMKALKTSKSDIQFLKSLPEDDPYPRQWFPNEDIAGGLHDIFYQIGQKHGFIKD